MDTPPHKPLKLIEGTDHQIGPIFGAIIVILVLLAGAVYFFKQELGKESASGTASTTTVIIYTHEPPASATTSLATSTGNPELDAIENSLYSQSADVSNLSF